MKRREYITRDEDDVKKELTDLQIKVTKENATEMPHRNEYDQNFNPGIYVCLLYTSPSPRD